MVCGCVCVLLYQIACCFSVVFILGSACHGPGFHRLFGSSSLSLIRVGHRTVGALLVIELFLYLIFNVFLSQQTVVRAVTVHLS